MQIVEYDPAHAFDIISRGLRDEDQWLKDQDWVEAANGWHTYGPGWTLIEDEVVMCFGVVFLGNGNGEVWGLMSELINKYPVAISKAIKSKLSEMMKDLKRLQTIIHPDHKKAIRFAKFLGFSYEGTMKKIAVTGDDLMLYGRVS